jgi:hypothetical protein
MRRIRPERPAPDPSDREIAADVLLRQEPDEEENEEEDEGDGKEDDDEDNEEDDGYSECRRRMSYSTSSGNSKARFFGTL